MMIAFQKAEDTEMKLIAALTTVLAFSATAAMACPYNNSQASAASISQPTTVAELPAAQSGLAAQSQLPSRPTVN